MDLVADMLLNQLLGAHTGSIQAARVRPHFVTAFSMFPGLSDNLRFNLNRVATRFLSYPAEVLWQRRKFDLFHIADHTYGHLAQVLPASRTGVFCHDVNAFSALLPGNAESAAPWRKAMARAQLRGIQRAAIVFYSTEQVRAELVRHRLVEHERLIWAPYGVSPEFWNSEGGESELPPGCPIDRPFLLNVGSSDSRKRLDVLFRVFGAVRAMRPDIVLIQQGAQLNSAQTRLLAELGLTDAFVQPPQLSRRALAALYRRAALVLLPSESEGFGLPLIEALAAGSPVVASDIPVFREVGQEAVVYCGVGEIENWASTVLRLLYDPRVAPPLSVRQARAKQFTWERHAEIVLNSYLALLGSQHQKAVE